MAAPTGPGGERVTVPMETLMQLMPFAQQLGLDLPNASRFAPKIQLGQSYRTLAQDIGALLSRHPFFVKGELVVRVDLATGKEEEMTPSRFIGEVEEFCVFEAPARAGRVRESLSESEAKVILAQRVFRDRLRPLAAVHTVRLPVRRADGKVEWLRGPEGDFDGYDVETGILTLDLLPYPADWSLEQAQAWLLEVCEGYSWNWPEEDAEDAPPAAAVEEAPHHCIACDEITLWGVECLACGAQQPIKPAPAIPPAPAPAAARSLLQNRSVAVHTLAMLGTYCRGMFAQGTLRPMFSYFGNKPGTGKTTLVAMALAMLHGDVGAMVPPKDEDKLTLKLETLAASLAPYALLDDLPGGLRSAALNNFITARKHNFRRYHSQFLESIPNVTQLFVTGNETPTSEDIGRRSLLVNLFLADEVRERRFKRIIDGEWLSLPETRVKFLAAMCAIVKTWLSHCELCSKEVLHPSPTATFERFTGVLGAMVICAGFTDPLVAPETDVGGMTTAEEVKRLVQAVAASIEVEGPLPFVREVKRVDLVDKAREIGLLESIVGLPGDPEIDDAAKKRLGLAMRRMRAQRLRDKRGRTFLFGHKKKNSGAVYPITFVGNGPGPA